ncbi:hypothetical protein V5E97_24545 [Singulisphaera sp. Ch08]|uniref:Uncharacterized protein n=1 Tax=Singulisphaera sp. Ch08 TaxID=3120278 RepID=A0AAU7C8N2_9BACT
MPEAAVRFEDEVDGSRLGSRAQLAKRLVEDAPSDQEGHEMRLRTLMTAVAGVGLILGLAVHIQVLGQDEDDFALPIFMGKVFAMTVLFAIAVVVGFFVYLVRLVRKDNDYAAQLRRNDVPARCSVILAEVDSSSQEEFKTYKCNDLSGSCGRGREH